jgi:hypothetical protein
MNAHLTSPARKRQSRVLAEMRVPALLALVALVFAGWCLAGGVARADSPAPATYYRVIINPQNPLVSMERELASQIFLKKVVTWGHGGVIRPVDLAIDSPVRRKFSQEVLGRSVAAVRSYWLQIIFAGRGVPPPVLASDAEVIGYVLREPGAIGYVSNRADLRGARLLIVQ